MKKIKKFILIIALAFPLLVFAQPVIMSNDFVQAPDSGIFSKANQGTISALDFIQTGSNFVWNYDTLIPTGQDWRYFFDPNETDYQGSHFTVCYLECLANGLGNIFTCPGICNDSWDSLDIAQPSPDSIDLGVFVLSDIVNFFNNTGTNGQYQQEAFAFNVEVLGLPVPWTAIYSSPDVLYDFPISIGNTDSSISSFSVDLTSLGVPLNWIHWQKRVNEVEGWGTVSTPYGQFSDALKVRSFVYQVDTLILSGDTFDLSTFLPPPFYNDSVIEFKWLDSNHGFSVLDAKGYIDNADTVINNVKYLDSLRCFEPLAFFGYIPIPAYLDTFQGSSTVDFINFSSNGDQFFWDFGDGGTSTLANPSHTYQEAGTFNVQLTLCNSACNPLLCDTLILPVVVIDSFEVVANFTALPSTACEGDTILFSNTSIRDSSWFWDFGDGSNSILQSPEHAYTTSGIYNVTLIASNSFGSDTVTKQVEIGQLPIAGFSYSDTLTDVVITFSDQSINTGPSSNYLWTFSGGSPNIGSSTDQNPQVIFNQSGQVTVCQTVDNGLGCNDVACQTIDLTECLNADFDLEAPLVGCPGDTIIVSNTSVGIAPIQYAWLLNGSPYSQGINTFGVFPKGGPQTFTLIADNGICPDTVSQTKNLIEAANAGADVGIGIGDSVQLNGTGGSVPIFRQWKPNTDISCAFCASPIAYPSITRDYEFILTDLFCGVTRDTVKVAICEKDTYEPNDDQGTATLLTGQGIIGHGKKYLCPSTESDWYSYQVNGTGQTFTANYTFLSGALHMEIYDTNGLFASNFQMGNYNTQIQIPNIHPGNYWIKISAPGDQAFNTSSPYELGIELKMPSGFSGTKPDPMFPVIKDDFEPNTVKLYPNPFRDFIFVGSQSEQTVHLTFRDLLGRIIMKAKTYNGKTVSTVGLPSGLYMVEWEIEGQKGTVKLIKE